MLDTSHYDKELADYAVNFIQCLKHTKGVWADKPFQLMPWQEQIIRDLFGIVKDNGYRQFNTAYIEIPKKQGKTELAAAVALMISRLLKAVQGVLMLWLKAMQKSVGIDAVSLQLIGMLMEGKPGRYVILKR